MGLDDAKPGDARNALFLAQACSLAYLDAAAGVARFRDELGLEAVLISVGIRRSILPRMTVCWSWLFAALRHQTHSTGSKTGCSPTPTIT